jgi:hypothetical protein
MMHQTMQEDATRIAARCQLPERGSPVAAGSKSVRVLVVLDADTSNQLRFHAERRKESIEATTVEMIKAGLGCELAQMQENE